MAVSRYEDVKYNTHAFRIASQVGRLQADAVTAEKPYVSALESLKPMEGSLMRGLIYLIGQQGSPKYM